MPLLVTKIAYLSNYFLRQNILINGRLFKEIIFNFNSIIYLGNGSRSMSTGYQKLVSNTFYNELFVRLL